MPHENAPAVPTPETEKRSVPRVHRVDFTRPSKFTKDQERKLLSAHETFCRTAGTRLSSELRLPIDFEVAGHKQLTWTTAISEFASGMISAVVEIQPIGRRVLLSVQREFLLALIERLLGGDAVPEVEPRRLTDVDMALARQLMRRLVDQLSIVWQDIVEVDLAFERFEPDAESAMLAPLSEPTWVLEIGARVRETSFSLVLAIPYRSIKPLEERLPHGEGEGGDAVDASTAGHVQAAIGEAEIELRAEVGAVELTAEDVLALEVGDVLRLDADSVERVTVYAGDVPVHRARPGRSKRRRAVQVLGRAGADG